MQPVVMSAEIMVRPWAMIFAGTHAPCQSGLIDNTKSRMLLLRVARDNSETRAACEKSGTGQILQLR
jgi:hypothetical protein